MNEDAELVKAGRQPGNWLQVSDSLAALIVKCGEAITPEAQESIKNDYIKVIIAHSHAYAASASADSKKWFDTIHAAAQAELDKLPAELHGYATHNGLDKAPNIEITGDGHPTQGDTVPYLQAKFVKSEVRKMVLTAKHSSATAEDAVLTALLFQTDYVDAKLSLEPPIAELNDRDGIVRRPETKAKTRADLKTKIDYKGSPVPAGDVCDTIRTSHTSKRICDQERYTEKLTAVGGKKNPRLVPVRLKSTNADKTAKVKQTIVNMLYTPYVGVTGSKPITFKLMVADPAFDAVVSRRQARDEIPDAVVDAALAILKHKKVRGKALSMIVEFQFYIDYYLQKRKLVHIFYKIARCSSAVELTMDFAKYATGEGDSKAMAYHPPPAVMNPEYLEGRLKKVNKKHSFAGTAWDLRKHAATESWSDTDCVWIIAALATAPNLEKVVLSGFTADGMAAVLTASAKSTSIIDVNFKKGPELERFRSALSPPFAVDTEDTELCLNSLGYTDADCEWIVAWISRLPKLEKLVLSGNTIGDAGAAVLAKAIAKCPSLMHVQLDINKIGNPGAMAIATGIKKCRSFKHLDIDYDDKLGKLAVDALREVGRVNPDAHEYSEPDGAGPIIWTCVNMFSVPVDYPFGSGY